MFWKGCKTLPIYHKMKNDKLLLKRATWLFKCCLFAFASAKVTRNTVFASASFLNRESHGDDILKFSWHYCNNACLVIPWELQFALTLISSVQFSCVIGVFCILCCIWITQNNRKISCVWILKITFKPNKTYKESNLLGLWTCNMEFIVHDRHLCFLTNNVIS